MGVLAQDEVIVSEEDTIYWGSKAAFPTKEDFVKALYDELGMTEHSRERLLAAITEVYLRINPHGHYGYDYWWVECKGPVRGAAPAWRVDYEHVAAGCTMVKQEGVRK